VYRYDITINQVGIDFGPYYSVSVGSVEFKTRVQAEKDGNRITIQISRGSVVSCRRVGLRFLCVSVCVRGYSVKSSLTVRVFRLLITKLNVSYGMSSLCFVWTKSLVFSFLWIASKGLRRRRRQRRELRVAW